MRKHGECETTLEEYITSKLRLFNDFKIRPTEDDRQRLCESRNVYEADRIARAIILQSA